MINLIQATKKIRGFFIARNFNKSYAKSIRLKELNMRINRFLIKFNSNSDNLQIKNAEIYNQIRNVLKLKPGGKIILFDGEGNEVLAEILNIDVKNKTIDLIVLKKRKDMLGISKEIILYCSILKKENFELVAQKATEIGIAKIVPIISERTIKIGIKKERLEKIIKEASEQSGRTTLLEIVEPMNLKQALELAKENDLNLFFDISGESTNFPISVTGKMGIFIGPEGGWNKNELELANRYNMKIVKLSDLTFRAETAAIIAGYLSFL